MKKQEIEAAEQANEYQPKADNGQLFHEEWKITTEVTDTAYKKLTDRSNYNQKTRIHKTDNCIKNTIKNNKKNIMKAYRDVGSLKVSFKPHTNLCRGINYEIISKEENIMNRWKTYFQDLLNIATFEHKTFFDSTHTNEIHPEQQELENELQNILHRTSNTISE